MIARSSAGVRDTPLRLVPGQPSTRRRLLEGGLSWAGLVLVLAMAGLLGRGVPLTSVLRNSDPGPAGSTLVAVGNTGCLPDRSQSRPQCAYHEVTQLVDALDPALVLPLGDTAGAVAANAPGDDAAAVWQRLKPRMRGVDGDRDGRSTVKSGVRPAGPGYYSYDYNGWHLVALNSNCADVGGCGRGSPQERWLVEDLRRSSTLCTLAYWHRPRFASGRLGSDSTYDAFWRDLYDADADVVLNGDSPAYERFARQSPDGVLDVHRGLREFVVGSGSSDPTWFSGTPLPRSVVRNATVAGVLQITVSAGSYTWRFVPVFNQRFGDTGTGRCH